jgi:nucleotide-binding universal stress UspA family protein
LQQAFVMTFTKILSPTDFSPGAEQALRTATQLSVQTGSELVIMHSWYEPPSIYSAQLTMPPTVEEQVLEDAERRLASAVAECKLAGVKRASSSLVSGIPWCEIVALLANQSFDLCVIGTEGRSGLRRFLLGSVAEKVVRHAPCSVLAIHPDDTPRPLRHILIPTDLSEGAAFAGSTATEIIASEGTITLLHVIEVPISYAGQHPVRSWEKTICQHARDELERYAQSLRLATTARIRTELRIGHPGHDALELIEKDPSIDLVAIGSHGRTGIKRVLLGSVAEKIVRHAPRPVLVARKRS